MQPIVPYKMKKIILLHDNSIFQRGLSGIQAIEFKSNHFDGMGHNKMKYRIEDMTESEVEEWKDGISNKTIEAKKEFMKTLSLAQMNDINVGAKVLKYNKEIGWHLVIVSLEALNGDGKDFFSPHLAKSLRDDYIKPVVRSCIKEMKEEIFLMAQVKYLDFNITAEEFYEQVNLMARL